MSTARNRSYVQTRLRRATGAFLAVTTLLALLGVTRASAPPIGQLVNEKVTTVSTTRDALIAVALPHAADGQSWRLARDVDPKILQQVSEGKVGNDVVIVFAATGAGTARVVFAQTHGEAATVSRAITHVVTVR